jgi:polar amino acid transport system substrate-binding protein
MRTRRGVLAIVALVIAGLTGCGVTVPSDPHGTFDRVQDGVLRVGATHHEPWVEVVDSGDPEGSEARLLTEFAAAHDADIEWTTGNEESLVEALERGELDVAIGGFTDASPWTDRAAATVAYAEAEGADGGMQKHVMLVRMGENRFLTELETFLVGTGGRE